MFLLMASLLSELETWSEELSRNTRDGTEERDMEHSNMDEEMSEHRLGKRGRQALSSELLEEGVSDFLRIILFSFGTIRRWQELLEGLFSLCFLFDGDKVVGDVWLIQNSSASKVSSFPFLFDESICSAIRINGPSLAIFLDSSVDLTFS